MKKLFNVIFILSFLSVIFFSCNKDDTTTPTGGNTNTGPVTQTFNSTPGLNKFITNAQPVFDTISANITDNITANNISDVKLALSDVSSVEVNKIKFSLIHGSVEVAVIDSLTKSGVGNFTNTVLWDSSGTPIDQGTTPYTGTFRPQHQFGSFVNKDPAGQWIIKITYNGSLKTGVIKSWGITITYQVIQPIFTGAWQMDQLQLVSAPINGTWNAIAKQGLVAYGSVPASSFGWGELTFGGTVWQVQQTVSGGFCLDRHQNRIFIDAQNGFLPGYNSSLQVTNDGGNSWTMRNITPTLVNYWCDYGCCFINSQTGWVTGQSQYSYDRILTKTTDGGQSWNQVFDFTANYSSYEPSDIEFIDANTGFACGGWGSSNNRIYKTTNGGLNWNYTSYGNESYSDVFFINQMTGWISSGHTGGGNAYLRKTIDGGNTWTYYIVYTGNCSFNGVQFKNANFGYGSVYDNTNNKMIILITHDGGQTWSILTDKIFAYGGEIVDEQNIWLIGGNNMIIRTTNGGTNWKVEYITSSPIKMAYFSSANNGMFFSETGEIWKSTGATDPNFWGFSGYCTNSLIRTTFKGNDAIYFAGGNYNTSSGNVISFSANGFSGGSGNSTFGSGTYNVVNSNLKITLNLANSEKWDFTLRR